MEGTPLPPPINLFSFLPPRDLCTAARVCHGWGDVVNSDLVWHSHAPWTLRHEGRTCKQQFSETVVTTKTWKSTMTSPYTYCNTDFKNCLSGVRVIDHFGTNLPSVYVSHEEASLYVYTQPFDNIGQPQDMNFINPNQVDLIPHHTIPIPHSGDGGIDNWKHLLVVVSMDGDISFVDTRHGKFGEVVDHLENKSLPYITAIKFSGDGSRIFTANTDHEKQAEIVMLDVETRSIISKFGCDWVHSFKRDTSICDVCPTKNGSQFVCASYWDLYHWDTRIERAIAVKPFVSESDSDISVCFTKYENELFVSCKAKNVTYSFPDFTPTHFQFSLREGLSAVYMDDSKGLGVAGADVYLMDSLMKTAELLPRIRFSGGKYCHFNPTGDTLALLAESNFFEGNIIMTANPPILPAYTKSDETYDVSDDESDKSDMNKEKTTNVKKNHYQQKYKKHKKKRK